MLHAVNTLVYMYTCSEKPIMCMTYAGTRIRCLRIRQTCIMYKCVVKLIFAYAFACICSVLHLSGKCNVYMPGV